MAVDWIMLAFVAIAGLVAISIYNRLVALNRRCDQAAADIDVQLKQRHDLLPNLVETVKGYAGHERGTLEAVIRARNAAVSSAPGAQQMRSEAALESAIGRLMVVAEAYPELKASANFSELQAELSDIENKIAASRRFLNAAVNEYNTTRDQFPANLLANLYGFNARAGAEIEASRRAEIEAAPAVKF